MRPIHIYPNISPSRGLLTFVLLVSSILSILSSPFLSTAPYLTIKSPFSISISLAVTFPSTPSNNGAPNARAISTGFKLTSLPNSQYP
ncbi:hypothetical protein GQ44DRAFT_352478 [Phaeosphaeriaceae sp. PMI808]|nr:hypothetical protein GQ44DRAFT_352478 [Phaeosphaeriaceae sp. PMI808]